MIRVMSTQTTAVHTDSTVPTPDVTWDAPNPGPWLLDAVHWPNGVAPIVADLYPALLTQGFGESFRRWGLLLDTVAFASINGFLYLQPQPFDRPGPDGPPTAEWLGSEVERRTGIAGDVLATKAWREVMERWDADVKPAAVARHRELGDVDLRALDDDGLRAHLDECVAHLADMVLQHHRFNADATMLPSDFALQVGAWLGEDPDSFLGVFDDYSPASGIVSPELAPAIDGLRSAPAADPLLHGDAEPAQRLRQLRDLVPAVDEYVRSIGFRLVDGLDIRYLTTIECPELILGRLASGQTVDADRARRRADAFADAIRTRLSPEHREAFDELLAEARLVYRLRDERALYSDISALGLLRLALLEAGQRLADRGALAAVEHVLELDRSEIMDLLRGASAPSAGDIAGRVARRDEIRAQGAPIQLGPPPPEPPPVDQLPPPLARVMGAMGYAIDGLFGQLDEADGDDTRIGGIPAGMGTHEGRVLIVRSAADLLELEPGDVLVSRTTGEGINSTLHLIGAIVTDHGGVASHAAIVARECGFPAVVGTTNATHRLRNGQIVRVDGTTGEVRVLS